MPGLQAETTIGPAGPSFALAFVPAVVAAGTGSSARSGACSQLAMNVESAIAHRIGSVHFMPLSG
jgi:hypothetical protein